MNNCPWWGPGYWSGWFWLNQVFWLLLLGAIGFLIYHAIKSTRSDSKGNLLSRSSQRIDRQAICPNCGAPVEQAYLRCPECHYRLKVNCPSCGKLVKTSWDICPYCEAQLTETSQARDHH